MDALARFCADALDGGGTAAIADRAAMYVSDETWRALVKEYRGRGCDDLAQLARDILNGKEHLHDVVAQSAGVVLGFLGRSRIERTFAQELARTIPLPVDAPLSAAARGLQIAGIYICLVGNQNLAECACLRDVFKVEGKERIAQLMQAAVGDWRELPTRLPGSSSGK
ncbi:hypothetical protein [Embleya sp. AB8]|uniref:hypothetical protein n=1 Tax=Embleya sp. AB8 TaxID=3156304 RepID=UPI003C7415E8